MKFSVVTPSFNQGEFLPQTLASVAAQGVALEHVIMDGGSTDQSVAVLREFGHGIRWVSERDGGQTDAVNKGICATDGEIIAWINSDDVYYPHALETVGAFFTAHPEVDVVYGMADHIDRQGRAFEAYPTEAWNFERLKETCYICQPATFFRRRVVDRFGLLEESLRYCMDYEYWLRLGKAGVRFAYLEEKLAGSRLYAENKTLGARAKVHAEINDMFKRKFGRVPDRWLYNYAHVLAEQKVDREQRPRRFAWMVGAGSLLAAIRWNRGVSQEMRATVSKWLFA